METVTAEQYEPGAIYSRKSIDKDDAGAVCIQAKSGNVYFCHASSPMHIRVTNRNYTYNDRVPAVFNGVEYDLNADFTLNKSDERPWEPFYLNLERVPWRGKINDYTPAAKRKAFAEVAEVARTYIEGYPDHMSRWVRKWYAQDAKRLRKEAREHRDKANVADKAAAHFERLRREWDYG